MNYNPPKESQITNTQHSEGQKTKVSIILPMYNNYEYVNLCLDSILKAKTNLNFKIYVLDDQSLENEAEKVKKLCDFINTTTSFEVNFIRNEYNLGFAGNVNKGLKLSLADNLVSHICIINSDTIVTHYWLDDLVEYSHNALVSPVSNSVGNEQIIRVPYDSDGPCGHTRQSAFNFATQWRLDHIGNVINSTMIGFFCILAGRELFEKVGFLDEAFGRGYYEDDDYCHRILAMGLELKIVRQCFVHHFGSISFNSLQNVSIQELFKKNLEIFKRKHNILPVNQTNAWLKAVALELEWQYNKKSPMEKVIRDWFVPKHTPGKSIEIEDRLVDILNQYIISKFGKYPIASATMRRFFELVIGPESRRKNALSKFKTFLLKYTQFKSPQQPIAKNNKSTIYFFFSTQTYQGRQQRPQHIAQQLARNNNIVFWVDPEFQTRKSKNSSLTKIEKGLFLLNISGIDYSNFYTSGLTQAESLFVFDKIKTLVPSDIDTKNKIKFFIQSPFWAELTNNNPFEVIYDCMDLHEGFSTSTLEISYLERKLISNANKIIVSSEYLSKFISDHFSNLNKQLPIAIIKNGCDPEHFQPLKTNSNKITNIHSATVGYFGAIADWFDAELVYKAAELLPDINFEFIGEITNHYIKETALPKNIKLFGEKPYKDLPLLTEHWDCALIPFKINELILATNPVKLYEYSALGFPVVSTPIPEVIAADIKTYSANNPEDFAKQILTCLKENTEKSKQLRSEFAKLNSWKNRGKNILQFIDGANGL